MGAAVASERRRAAEVAAARAPFRSLDSASVLDGMTEATTANAIANSSACIQKDMTIAPDASTIAPPSNGPAIAPTRMVPPSVELR